jgi:integrase/recombinase XerD
MAIPSLYIRAKQPNGKWRYRRIKEGKGVKTGELEPPFFIRPSIQGKRHWKGLTADSFRMAKEEAEYLVSALNAQAKGLTVAEADALTNAGRVPIKTAVGNYLEQKGGKTKKTVAQYQGTLNQFVEALGKVRFLDEITQDVLRRYKRFMTEQGYSGKTNDTRLTIIFSWMKKNGVATRLPSDEMPVVEEEAAVPFGADELKKLFAAMNGEEAIRYKFFLGTGCRDKEVTYASWADLDVEKKFFYVRRKEDVGFTPKSHESRVIPLPDTLVTLLKARKKSAPHPRWIFVNEENRPDSHFLRKLKRIAHRAGLNCGHCSTEVTKGRYDKRRKVQVTCKTDPVCTHIYLHRLRKTCATRWHEAGIPVRTIQAWLGHKNLDTTQTYLGVTDPDKLRGNINAAFGD